MPNPRAKSYRLALRPDGSGRCTVPRRGTLADARRLIRGGSTTQPRVGENTTIAVVATNARLRKDQAGRMALMADDLVVIGQGRLVGHRDRDPVCPSAAVRPIQTSSICAGK